MIAWDAAAAASKRGVVVAFGVVVADDVDVLAVVGDVDVLVFVVVVVVVGVVVVVLVVVVHI